ncbi:MAG: hypothetical protein ABL867_01275 [Rickettsiales bacterium]
MEENSNNNVEKSIFPKPKIVVNWEETRPSVRATVEKFRDDLHKIFEERGARLDALIVQKTGKSRFNNGVAHLPNGEVYYCTDLRSIAELSRNPQYLEGVAIHEATHIKNNDILNKIAIEPVYKALATLRKLVKIYKYNPKVFYNCLSSDTEMCTSFLENLEGARRVLQPAVDFIKKEGIGELSDKELHKKFKDNPRLQPEMVTVMANVEMKRLEIHGISQFIADVSNDVVRRNFFTRNLVSQSLIAKSDLINERDTSPHKFVQDRVRHEALIGNAIKSLGIFLENTGDLDTIGRAAEYRADEATLSGKNSVTAIERIKKVEEYNTKHGIREVANQHPLTRDRISHLESLLAERNGQGQRTL